MAEVQAFLQPHAKAPLRLRPRGDMFEQRTVRTGQVRSRKKAALQNIDAQVDIRKEAVQGPGLAFGKLRIIGRKSVENIGV